MSNGKNGRKRLILRILAAIIILVVLYSQGINLLDYILSDEQEYVQNDENQDIQENENQHTVQEDIEGELMLTMIDVGQADSFLLLQDGETALIDCGTRSTGKDVVEYLKSQGITKLDYVFGTHQHEDHMGGMYDVITNFDIGTIIIPEIEKGMNTTNWYMKLLKEMESGAYNVKYAKLGDVYNLGKATMEIIGPISKQNDNINNYSTVLKVSFGEMDIIMTGDAETEVEKEILESGANIDAEILKVGHHGSDTSTSEEFLDAIGPEYALISAKEGNKYEHPNKSTMDKLESRDIEVYRTDENGTVIVTITTETISFSCSPGDYLSGKELEERDAK